MKKVFVSEGFMLQTQIGELQQHLESQGINFDLPYEFHRERNGPLGEWVTQLTLDEFTPENWIAIHVQA